MNSKVEQIKKSESPPKIIKNLYSKKEVDEFLALYKALPVTTHNKKQNVIKKRWLQGYNEKLEKLFCERLKKEIGNFQMDNLKDEKGKDIYGLIQESYAPIGLHVDAGFDLKNQVYKQSLIPLTPVGSTIIFKNRFYDGSTSFTLDPEELKKKNLSYGQNKRSSEHLTLYGDKPFDKEIHAKYLKQRKQIMPISISLNSLSAEGGPENILATMQVLNVGGRILNPSVDYNSTRVVTIATRALRRGIVAPTQLLGAVELSEKLLTAMGCSLVLPPSQLTNKDYSLLYDAVDTETVDNPNKLDIGHFANLEIQKVSLSSIFANHDDSFFRLDAAIPTVQARAADSAAALLYSPPRGIEGVVRKVVDMSLLTPTVPTIRALRGI